MHYIYEIKNKINNKRYIGRTKYPINRKNRHFKDLKDNIHHCLYLQNAYNKYGEQNFEFSILIDNLSLEDATKLEFEMINSNEELYNMSKCSTGGDLLSNNPNKDVIIKKRSKTIKLINSKLTKKELSLKYGKFGKNNDMYGRKKEKCPFYGIKRTEEQKLKLSNSLQGRIFSDEHRENISKSKKGSKPWNKGKKLQPLTDEHKKLLSDSLKGRVSEKRKKVYCEGVIYDCLKDAANNYNITPQGMLTRVRSKTNRFKEFYYYEDNSLNKCQTTIETVSNYKLESNGVE